jgi:putative heme-binding domain-containing protein
MNATIEYGSTALDVRFFDSTRTRTPLGYLWWPLVFLLAMTAAVVANEPQWVWYPERDLESVGVISRYFRKSFELDKPTAGSIEITCDDEYELFVNGDEVGTDGDVATVETYDILEFLQAGENVVAVRAKNIVKNSRAGLAVRIKITDAGDAQLTMTSGDSWKTNNFGPRGWNRPGFRDTGWLAAAVVEDMDAVAFDSAKPAADGAPVVAGPSEDPVDTAARFTTPAGFRVERVISGDKIGSIIALAFNERGDLLVSREDGGILTIRGNSESGLSDEVSTFCDKVKTCQGLLPLNGMVFVVGDGPDGSALYRLTDSTTSGKADKIDTLMKFHGPMQEHGPHAVTLGPEGLLYVAMGNHTRPLMKLEPTSPYHHSYEGDVVHPRYEDPGGHGNNLKAPGGLVVRTDTEGSFCELYAGGFRNHYDLAFNADGDLFTFDSDMEWDAGLPWYRPCRVLHVIPGGEYGWRSGWAKWPEYYPDSLGSVCETGRGSPAGMCFYEHNRLPEKYRGAMLAADWTLGRIWAVFPKAAGGSFQAESEALVQGQPLNATGVCVGPDGWVYFATGGRGTEGGVYRLVYDPPVDPEPKSTGLMAAIKQPQPTSAWGRDRIARARLKLGREWTDQIVRFIDDTTNPGDERARALGLMQLVGPFPSHKFLAKLADDTSAEVRRTAAYLMGIHTNAETATALSKLLDDSDASVVRIALESFIRARQAPPVDKVLVLLQSADTEGRVAPRTVQFAAMRVLQATPSKLWLARALNSDNPGVFLHASLAAVPLTPDAQTLDLMVSRSRSFLRGYLTDQDFLSMLRLMQLVLLQGPSDEDNVDGLASELAEEYPSGDPRMNRELVRLLVYMQESTVLERMTKQLEREDSEMPERLHLAMHMRFMQDGWDRRSKQALLDFYEKQRSLDGGASYGRYLDNAARDFLALLTPVERGRILAHGHEMPGMALQILRSCPKELNEAQINSLIELDRLVAPQTDASSQELATGILAVLGDCGDVKAIDYVRSVFDLYPERRQEVAMVLAARPTDDLEEAKKNWPLLVRSLTVTERLAAEMVLESLSKIRLKPVKSEPTRQVILRGLSLGESGGDQALAVLKLWHQQEFADTEPNTLAALGKWQSWFHETWPDSPAATLPKEDPAAQWNQAELSRWLTTAEGYAGDPTRGAELFAGKGQCAKCHRSGSVGETIGPDLSSVGVRFQRKEILESILHPSQAIGDQYRSHTVVTSDGQVLSGMIGSGGTETVVVLTADGRKVELARDDIDELTPSNVSAMPKGLIDGFTKQEIADLFSFMTRSPVGLARKPEE